ncbi:MAG TPA: ATP phosphoribosyltransferase regulatory subunit [Sphingopyxis sp.]|nr:ATP phosphoribosyltransferase regulatory subunit [Sphingopyxis sp.]HMP45786.1 ATP phosphoribosyltransferase regulatory subunit [Sphingopyxis sp.]HMQ19500.1 ATP phosphoribosyltransferase regulatory subunit [Sphingopyxis sp.]
MPKTPALLPEGLRDRLPAQAEAASRVTRALVDAMRAHGYGRVSPPLAEFRETLGGDDERSSRDLLRFTDPVSQRTLALRPDITRQVGRIATSLLAHAPRPLRLCYAGQVVKLRASQLRPAREMLQVGAELIGSDSVAAAREIVTVAIDALDAAGIGPVTIDFTLPDLVDLLAGALPVAASLDELRDELDAKDAGALVRIGAGAWLPLLRATGPFDPALADLRAFDAGGLLASRLDALEAIAAPVRGRATLTLDPTERHGFAYQSWFGFQLFVPGQGDAIGRGGAYAIPVGDAVEEAAVGFSLYPDPLIDEGLGGEDVAERRIFLPLGHDPALAANLRADGWQTVAALTDAEDAARLGCGWRLGPDGPQSAGD